MISTSDDYKFSLTQPRQKWRAKATIDFTDYNLDNSVQTSVNTSNRCDVSIQMADGIDSPTYKWFSWSNFQWGLHLKDAAKTELREKGGATSRLSGDDGTLAVQHCGIYSNSDVYSSNTVYCDEVDYPRFNVYFAPRQVNRLRIAFDDKWQQWASDFDVLIYSGTTLLQTVSITGGTSAKWESNLVSPLLQVTRIEFVIKKWSTGYETPRIMESFTSVQKIYTSDEDLFSVSTNEEIDPDGATSPVGNISANSCNISLKNLNNEFDNDNVNSPLAGLVSKNRRIKPYIVKDYDYNERFFYNYSGTQSGLPHDTFVTGSTWFSEGETNLWQEPVTTSNATYIKLGNDWTVTATSTASGTITKTITSTPSVSISAIVKKGNAPLPIILLGASRAAINFNTLNVTFDNAEKTYFSFLTNDSVYIEFKTLPGAYTSIILGASSGGGQTGYYTTFSNVMITTKAYFAPFIATTRLPYGINLPTGLKSENMLIAISPASTQAETWIKNGYLGYDGGLTYLNGYINTATIINNIPVTNTTELPLGTYYTDKWNIKNEQITADASAKDVIYLMGQQTYKKNQYIVSPADQSFTYTTTADFNSFTRDNIISSNDELVFGGSAILCNYNQSQPQIYDSLTPYSDYNIYSGYRYCGTAEKVITYSYTTGTSVKLAFNLVKNIPAGCTADISIDYGKGFEDVTDGQNFYFTPIDSSLSIQTFTLRVHLSTPDVTIRPSIQSIGITLSGYVSLYSMAVKVIQDFDSITNLIGDNYFIDKKLGEIIVPNAVMKQQSHRAALSTIAAAGGASAYCGRNGEVTVRTLSGVAVPVKTWSNNTIFSKNNPVNTETLYNRITVKTNPLTKNASSEFIGSLKVELAAGQSKDYDFNFSVSPVANDVIYTGLPSGVVASNVIVYYDHIEITITNNNASPADFSLTFTGYAYKVSSSQTISLDDTASTLVNGVIEYSINDNPLIQTVEQAQYITQLLIDTYKTQRREVYIECLPDPSIELGDTFGVDSNGQTGYYILNSEYIKFSMGDLTQEIKGVR